MTSNCAGGDLGWTSRKICSQKEPFLSGILEQAVQGSGEVPVPRRDMD